MKSQAFVVLIALNALHLSAHAGFLSSYVLGVPTSTSVRSLAGAALSPNSTQPAQEEGPMEPSKEGVETTVMHVSTLIDSQTQEVMQEHCGTWMSEQECVGRGLKSKENEWAQKNKQLLERWRLKYEDMVVEVSLPVGGSREFKYKWEPRDQKKTYTQEQWQELSRYKDEQEWRMGQLKVYEGKLDKESLSRATIIRVGEQVYQLPQLGIARYGRMEGVQIVQTVEGIEVKNISGQEQKVILGVKKVYEPLREGNGVKGFEFNAWNGPERDKKHKDDKNAMLGMFFSMFLLMGLHHVLKARGKKEKRQDETKKVGLVKKPY